LRSVHPPTLRGKDWAMCALGVWLVAVAAGGAFAGPVGIWAVGTVAPRLPRTVLPASRARRSPGGFGGAVPC
jgi:hypothetical protein